MKLELKTVFGELIFEGDFSSVAELVKAALAAKKSLRFANLCSANLSSADLRFADLRFANLRFANLRSADLRFADLRSADLRFADLSFADLRFADLSFADLRFANLRSANLSKKELAALYSQRTILPEGVLIGYKKLSDGTICQLQIPAEAKRVGGLVGRKCRAEYALVLAGEGASNYDPNLAYKVGEIVRPVDPFNDDVTTECESGIHFFITRQEAEAYQF